MVEKDSIIDLTSSSFSTDDILCITSDNESDLNNRKRAKVNVKTGEYEKYLKKLKKKEIGDEVLETSSDTENVFKDRLEKDSEIHINFKVGDFEKHFFCNFQDSTEDLYKSVFGEKEYLERKLIYEDMKLPRNLTLEEAGFFEGINYLTTDPEEYQFVRKRIFQNDQILKIKVNTEEEEQGAIVEIDKNRKISDLIKNKEEFVIIKNGTIVDNELLIKNVFQEGEVCDLISKRFLL